MCGVRGGESDMCVGVVREGAGETGYESHITLVQGLTSMRGTFVEGRGSGGVGSVWEGRGTFTYVHMYCMNVSTCMYVHTCTYVCMHVRMYVCTCTYTRCVDVPQVVKCCIAGHRHRGSAPSMAW